MLGWEERDAAVIWLKDGIQCCFAWMDWWREFEKMERKQIGLLGFAWVGGERGSCYMGGWWREVDERVFPI